uniref:Uncharacterized protein n=1 Tax=Solanum tuberosum TaxID=4113 RepID=M1DC12_SOLTU
MEALGLVLVENKEDQLAHRPMTYEMAPRPPNVPERARSRIHIGTIANPMGESPSGLGEPNLARPLVISVLRVSCDPLASRVEAKVGNPLTEVYLGNTFLVYLFTYHDAHTVEWSMFWEGKGANLIK